MDQLLKSYDNKFYLFDSKPKMKLYIIKNNNTIDDYYFNDLEFVLAKSLLNNLFTSKKDMHSNIKNKLNKYNKFNDKEKLVILNNLDLIDKKDYYKKNVKKKIISNLYELNQTGGGLFSFIFSVLNKTYSIYKSFSVVVDVCLDIMLLLPRFGILTESKIMLSIFNLLHSILLLDYAGITASLFAFIPNVGDLISAVGGLGIHLYRFIMYLNSSDDKDESTKHSNDDQDSETQNKIVHNVVQNNNYQLNKADCKLVNKYVPEIGSKYNIQFYERIKFL